MHWYPISQKEEKLAWNQAEAQSDEYGEQPWDGAAKFIGNLGEIVIREFFESYISDGVSAWEYYNAEEMDNGEPEFNENDFRLAELEIDVKSTVDLRKFNPQYTFDGSEDKHEVASVTGPAQDGFPRVENTGETDVYIFVLLINPEKPSPVPTDAQSATSWYKPNYEHTGNYVAVILGWMFADAFAGEAIGNLASVEGDFVRLHVRDLYELLMRAGIE